MKKLFGIGFLMLVSVAGWKIGEHMSTDALGMALGVIFGMMAGIPVALIALAARPKEVHNHYHAPSPQKTQEEPKKALADATRYTVVIPALPTTEHKQIGRTL
jgi:hypothetical protein